MIGRCIETVVPRLSPRWLAAIEAQVQLAQGKGWGSHTVTAEVEAVRQLWGPTRNDPKVILDVGANTGRWTTAALAAFPAARLHAFEPSPAAFRQLVASLGQDARVALHAFAVGAENAEAPFFGPAPGSELGSLTRRRLEHFGIAVSAQETVTVRTLSSWLDQTGLDAIDVLKLDIEGHEFEVLHAAAERLASISIIQFEFGGANIDTRTYWQDFWYLLSGADFDLYRLGPRGLASVSDYRERDEAFVTTNFFARKKT